MIKISDNIEELPGTLYKATHTSYNKLHKMGKIGRKWMLDEFTWDAYNRAMSKLYTGILNDPK